MEPIISVRDLQKVFVIGENEVHALNGLDFDIYQGELLSSALPDPESPLA